MDAVEVEENAERMDRHFNSEARAKIYAQRWMKLVDDAERGL